MKALSLWQPHLLAIELLLKPWETRGWSTAYRGPLALHAAQRRWTDQGVWHEMALIKLRRKLFPSVGEIGAAPALCLISPWLQYGAVTCVADLVDCVPVGKVRGRIGENEFWGNFRDVGEDGKPRFAFRLENVRVLPKAVPWRGMQGFFEVELGGEWEAPSVDANLSLFGEELR
jgi:activating signal cointegrator 1